MNKKNISVIAIGFIVLILIGGGLWWYRNSQLEKNRQAFVKGCEETGGTMQGNECQCPELFPKFNTEQYRCEDIFGNFPTSRGVAERFVKRKNYADECVANKKEIYVLPGTPITFCYPAEWGGAQVIDEVREGNTQSKLIFPKPGKEVKEALPTLYFGHNLSLTSGKAIAETIGPYSVLVREDKGTVSYTVQNAFQDYDFLITGPSARKEDMKGLIENLWFDDMIE